MSAKRPDLMMAERPMVRVLLLTPFVLSVGYLFLGPAWQNLDSFVKSLFAGQVQLALLGAVLIAAVVLNRTSPVAAGFRLSRVELFACSLPPLAILNVWTVAPGFPGSAGGYHYFLYWLTKYPNFGPINLEVLLGLICVVISSLTPAVFAMFAFVGKLRPRIAFTFLALDLLCLVPVFIVLDIGLLISGVVFVSPEHFLGPVLHLTGLAFMGVIAWKLFRKNET